MDRLDELQALLRNHAKHGDDCAASPVHSGWRPGGTRRCTCWLVRAMRLVYHEALERITP